MESLVTPILTSKWMRGSQSLTDIIKDNPAMNAHLVYIDNDGIDALCKELNIKDLIYTPGHKKYAESYNKKDTIDVFTSVKYIKRFAFNADNTELRQYRCFGIVKMGLKTYLARVLIEIKGPFIRWGLLSNDVISNDMSFELLTRGQSSVILGR